MTQGLGSGIQPLFASVNSLLIFMIIFIFFNDFNNIFPIELFVFFVTLHFNSF